MSNLPGTSLSQAQQHAKLFMMQRSKALGDHNEMRQNPLHCSRCTKRLQQLSHEAKIKAMLCAKLTSHAWYQQEVFLRDLSFAHT